MKFNIQLIFLLLVAIIGVCNAAVSFGIYPADPKHPNKCVTTDSNNEQLILDDGEVRPATLGSCYQIACGHSGDSFTLDTQSCGVALRNGKRVEEDLTVLYPDCCSR
ncbi:UNVERIFIED_CONTAM: hypothetical protein RMT77_000689 [Armadillidium vulgare]